MVVPNIATDDEGSLLGLTPATADPFTRDAGAAERRVGGDHDDADCPAKWVRYPSLAPSDPATGGFGNLFQHASLLAPAPRTGHCSNAPATACTADATCGTSNVCVFPGMLGTARVQTDAITFLLLNH